MPAIKPVYEVVNHRLRYLTIDGQGRTVTASGLVSVPVKASSARSPVLSYQHGTIEQDSEAPTNRATALEPAVVLASLGYIVVAADYVGYGASKGAPHPYLLSAPTAAAVIDLLTAAKTWRARKRVADNGRLFLIGYSECGFATVAERGSFHGDELTPAGFASNHAGGVLGGISTGQDITVALAIKPTSSIRAPRASIDRAGQPTVVQTFGRHDPCVGIRATPIAEAMLALVLMDHALRHRAQCGDVRVAQPAIPARID